MYSLFVQVLVSRWWESMVSMVNKKEDCRWFIWFTVLARDGFPVIFTTFQLAFCFIVLFIVVWMTVVLGDTNKQTLGAPKQSIDHMGKKQKSRYTFVAWLSPLQNAHKGRSIVHCVIFVSVLASTQNILDWKEQQLLLMFWLPPLFVGLLALQKPVHTMSPTSPRALRTMHCVLGGNRPSVRSESA